MFLSYIHIQDASEKFGKFYHGTKIAYMFWEKKKRK